MIYSQAVFVANLENVFGKKLNDSFLSQLSNDFKQIVQTHKADKEVSSIVNDLISDRLYYNERLNMGENYVLDEIDKQDIQKKIKDRYKSKAWNKKSEEEKQYLMDGVAKYYQDYFRKPFGTEKSNLFYKIYRIEEKLEKLLIEKYQAQPDRLRKYLWHPSEQEKYPPAYVKKNKAGGIIKDEEGKEILFLGDPNPISRGFKNPMAMKTLQILKKHLNYLLMTGKIDSSTKIMVEIARELNDANRRKAIQKYQNEKKRKRDEFKKLIEEYFNKNYSSNRAISEVMLDRYELWEEQTKKCIYCGQPISCSNVMNGTAQMEHTIPVKISNCYELYNLTLAHPECNAKKAKRFPSQWTDNYDNILNNVKFIYAKFKIHEVSFKETYTKARIAKDKTTKDTIVQNRHYHKMHMDYWKKKYETFTLEEVTNQFRRQQLTDTQIITKYALPYLKTVFNRVEVQKGITTARFRRIFQIEPEVPEKDRSDHSHHAIDAAVLTLIPPASIRDNMVKDYNEAVDNNTMSNYLHPKPRNWQNFMNHFITSIKDEIIINYVDKDRTLTQTFKYKRRRGEFVKDKNGNRIKQQGATTRGKLHDESIFGMVKMPETELRDGKHRLKLIEGKLAFQVNEKRNDNLFVVKRIKISLLSNIDDLEKIVVDPNLGHYLKKEIQHRMTNLNKTLEQILLEPIYAFGKKIDKNGNLLQPIRHIRCKIKTGPGSFIQFPATIKEIEPAFLSKKKYKQLTYATNAETPICAIYEWSENGKLMRELKPISILEMSRAYHFQKNKEFTEPKILSTKGSDKKKVEIVKELLIVLHKKQQVIFYKDNLEELKELYRADKKAFTKRIYRVLKFEDGKIYFDYHLTSRSDKGIMAEMERRGLPKKGDSKLNYEFPALRLRLSQGSLKIAIEGKHFEIKPDGTIEWIF
jgi:CRISPR-associated endonuclease Csn1